MVLRPFGPVAVRIALERAKAIGFERQKARSMMDGSAGCAQLHSQSDWNVTNAFSNFSFSSCG
jgi:hypothetical protein